MLPTKLYLDTARLGLMSPSAQKANLDFVRLAAEESASLYFERFLAEGVRACPDASDRFPALAEWTGIAGLKSRIAELAGVPDADVLLASRSAQLMKLAARMQFRVCRNVLTTDLSWPSYQQVLEHEAERKGNCVTTVPIRRRILFERMGLTDVTELLAKEYSKAGCDGLFLPVVDNFGVRVPIASIIPAIQRTAEVRFVVGDAAQAINHVHIGDCVAACDFIVGGCHKWLRAYHPMGIGLLPSRRARDLIREVLEDSIDNCDIDDPLLALTQQLETGRLDGYSETVNLASLFSCWGALGDVHANSRKACSDVLHDNVDRIAEMCRGSDWVPLIPARDFRTGIIMLQSNSVFVRRSDHGALRFGFHKNGIAVSTYPDGFARLSAPAQRLTRAERSVIRDALLRVSD